MSVIEKYNRHAGEYTSREYGDPGRYFPRRAQLVLGTGPRLAPGDRVVELGCADGFFAPYFLDAGFEYTGVDLSEPMVDVARERIGDRASFEVGNLTSWAPSDGPVAMTMCFRSSHFITDRVEWFRHLASFTEKKIVFDVSPRRIPLATLRREAAEAGLDRFELQPFLLPPRYRVPGPVAALLQGLEHTGPLALALLRFRCVAICAAWRSGS